MSLAALIITGCSYNQVDPGAPLYLDRIIIEPYQRLMWTGIEESGSEVVRDATRWEALWQEIWKNHTPTPPIPVVDFTKEMVAFVSMGSRPSTGYYIELQAAYEGLDGVEVQAVAVSPASNCGVGGAITAPVDIGRMPRVDHPVKFSVQSSVHRCD